MAGGSAGEQLRFLLISEAESMRDLLTEELRGRLGDFRLYWASQPELALTRVQDLLPHLVIMDDALGGASPSQLVKQLQAAAPGSPVLFLVTNTAIAQAGDVVLAGARGFLVKPFDPTALIGHVREVLAQKGLRVGARDENTAASLGRIVVFVAPKGGTGRTTSAVNTSIALHQMTKRSVVLVDADYSAPSVDVVLNLRSDRDLTHLLPRLAQLDQDLVSGLLAQHASGIRVLVAPSPDDLIRPITVPQTQQMLAHFKRMFGWVVVDLGLPLDEMAYAFLDAADRIVMTVLPELTGLRNTRIMLEHFRVRGYAADKVRLVLNRATMPAAVRKHDIEEKLHVRVAHTVPDDQPLVSQSINRGVPVMMAQGRSAVAKSYRSLATQIVGPAAGATAPQEKAAAKRKPAGNPLLARFTRGSQPADAG
jgi:pilus assembly protein CpaE